MMPDVSCWCGNRDLVPFSPGYTRCASCETLLFGNRPGPEIARVVDEDTEFYGRQYWFSHQEHDLGFPNIRVRARTDLPERCVHWVSTLLKYTLPPGRVLELGSGPGAFVAMLEWAGFEASGLEISPWVVRFIRDTFGVPVLLGRVENQAIEPASLDGIALMDVLEHFHDPMSTVRHCLDLLKPEGILLLQTPCYPEGRTFEDMERVQDPFLMQLKPTEHLYLFSRRSIGEFLRRLGVEHIAFEPPMFEYDMFVVASRGRLHTYSQAEIEAALSARPGGRLVQGLLDLWGRYLESEADRAARSDELRRQAVERELLEAELQAQRTERERLDREVQAQRAHIDAVVAQLRTLQHTLGGVRRTRTYRLLRLLGRWRFLESVADGDPGAASASTTVSK